MNELIEALTKEAMDYIKAGAIDWDSVNDMLYEDYCSAMQQVKQNVHKHLKFVE